MFLFQNPLPAVQNLWSILVARIAKFGPLRDVTKTQGPELLGALLLISGTLNMLATDPGAQLFREPEP